MHQRRFREDIRKNFFPERTVKPWQRLPRVMMELSSMEASEKSGDVALVDMV